MENKQLMNTIERTFERAQSESLGVSKHFIRQAVLSGDLPSIRAGNRYLINYELFLNYIYSTETIIHNKREKDKLQFLSKYDTRSRFIPES